MTGDETGFPKDSEASVFLQVGVYVRACSFRRGSSEPTLADLRRTRRKRRPRSSQKRNVLGEGLARCFFAPHSTHLQSSNALSVPLVHAWCLGGRCRFHSTLDRQMYSPSICHISASSCGCRSQFPPSSLSRPFAAQPLRPPFDPVVQFRLSTLAGSSDRP